jgi:hypothetical protein
MPHTNLLAIIELHMFKGGYSRGQSMPSARQLVSVINMLHAAAAG